MGFPFHITYVLGNVVQSLSYARLFATPWIAACQASPSFTISWSLLRVMSIESVMPSNHLILCHALLLSSASSFPVSRLFTACGQSFGARRSNQSILKEINPEYSLEGRMPKLQ